ELERLRAGLRAVARCSGGARPETPISGRRGRIRNGAGAPFDPPELLFSRADLLALSERLSRKRSRTLRESWPVRRLDRAAFSDRALAGCDGPPPSAAFRVRGRSPV